jgi:hypothetical protein
MSITAPPASPRIIGLAHYAGRAVLESVLTGFGLTFQQSVTLRLVALADGPVDRDRLAGEVNGSLKTGEAEAYRVLDELIGAGLVEADPARPSAVRITGAGRDVHASSSARTGQISARIYAGIPCEDLAAAGRVLAVVTERANAELDALGS